MKVVDAITGRLRPALPAWVALVIIVGATVIVLDRDAPAEPGPGEARLEIAEGGEAVVTRVGGSVEKVEDSTLLGPGDRVEMAVGAASLVFQDGIGMEIRGVDPNAAADDEEVAASSVVVDELPSLRGGDVLVVSGARVARIEADGTEFAVSGEAKVMSGLGVGVAAYEGGVEVDSAGQQRVVPALRQLNVPALGRPPAQPRALVYDGTDEWDRRHLREAIEFGDELEDYARGYTGTVRRRIAGDVLHLREVLPGLEEQEGVVGLLRSERRRPVGELLVGAAISGAAESGSFGDRWDGVFGFRDLGAHWGLVALDQQVDTMPLLDLIRDAISDSPLGFSGGDLELAAGPGPGGDGPGGVDGPSGDNAPGPGGEDVPVGVDDPEEGPGTTDGPTVTTSPPGTSPPGTSPPGTSPPGGPLPTTPTTSPPATPPPTTPTLPPPTLPPPTLPPPSIPLPTVPTLPPPTNPLPTIPLPTIPGSDDDDDLVGGLLDDVDDTTDDLIGGLLG